VPPNVPSATRLTRDWDATFDHVGITVADLDSSQLGWPCWHRNMLNSTSSSRPFDLPTSASQRYGILGGTSTMLTVGYETACD
jgi:hypothetical protein